MSDFLRNPADPRRPFNTGATTAPVVGGAACLASVDPKCPPDTEVRSAAKSNVIYIPGLATAGEMPASCDVVRNDQSVKVLPAVLIDVDDWDSLFGAVEERLRTTVETVDAAPTPLARQDALSRIRSVVLDCVGALDTLHQSLKQERRRQAVSSLNGPVSDAAVASSLTHRQGALPNN